MKVTLDLLGEDTLSRTLLRPARAATDLGPAFERGLDLVEDEIERQFATEGGGSWAPLAASTVRGKGHARILHDTGSLRTAATSGARRTVSAYSAEYAVDEGSAPYWIYHHSKKARFRLPRRPLLEVGERLKRGIMREIQRELFGTGSLR